MEIVFAKSMIEMRTTLSVTFTDGNIKTFNAVELAKSWLTMSNDDFYKLYGFNYVPSQRLQRMAKKELG